MPYSIEHILVFTIDGEQIRELVFANLAPGQTSDVRTIRITSVGSSTLTAVRIAAKLITGPVYGGTNEEGSEAMTEHWVEVRLAGVGSFQGIGGPYGNGSPSGNYFPLDDLAPREFVDIDVRVTLPASLSTERFARLRLGVSYRPT